MKRRVTRKDKRQLAKLLKDWREREGISQSQAAETLAVPIDTFQNWEIARTKPSAALENLLRAIIAK